MEDMGMIDKMFLKLFLPSHSPGRDTNLNLSTIQEFPPQTLLLQVQNFSLVPTPMKESKINETQQKFITALTLGTRDIHL